LSLRVLFIEDDDDLAERMSTVMCGAGFVVDRAADGETGWFRGETFSYDLVVLDLGLARLGGVEALKRWRAAGKQFGVLVLSARGSWSDRVELLNAGADDYVTKPIYPAELVARLHALLRRGRIAPEPAFAYGDLVLDPASGSVTVAGDPIQLTVSEARILSYLLHRRGRVVAQSELMEHVYADDDMPEVNTIQVYVSRLRKKLGRDVIRTLRGFGYKID
jgi:two-component system, OmpR family, response regulator